MEPSVHSNPKKIQERKLRGVGREAVTSFSAVVLNQKAKKRTKEGSTRLPVGGKGSRGMPL